MSIGKKTGDKVSSELEKLRGQVAEYERICSEYERQIRGRYDPLAGILEIAVISIDEHQRIRYFNKGAEEIFGYSSQEALGEPLALLLPIRFDEVHGSHVRSFMRSPEAERRMSQRMHVEILGRRKNGEEFPGDASISKIQIGDGFGATVFLLDVTEQKKINSELRKARDELEERVEARTQELNASNQNLMQELAEKVEAQDALQESEERFRCLVEGAVDAYYVADPQGRFISVNNAACEGLGYTREELLNLSIPDITLNFDPDQMAHLMPRILDGETVTQESLHRRIDGTSFPVEIRIGRLEMGKETYMFGLARDITERKETEEAFRQSEERYHSIFDNSNDGIFLIDAEENDILDANEKACQMLGYSRDELLSLRMSDIHPHELESLQAFAKLVSERGFGWTNELTCTTKRGDKIPTEISASKLRIDDKDRMLALVRDITERKRAEEELLKAKEELELRVAERTVELTETTARIKEELEERKRLEEQLVRSQKMEAIGRLAGGVSHDFNNLLTPIMSYADLLLMMSDVNGKQRTFLEEIQKAAERAANLTRQLLVFSRQQVVEPKLIDLNDLILNMDKMLRRLVRENIEMVVLPTAESLPFYIDVSQMEQILVNLVVNAVDAMPDGGTLTIYTQKEALSNSLALGKPDKQTENYVVLGVKDNGVGIAEDVKNEIFEPFFTTKPVGEGTGLGLSTCYSIAEQNGGHIAFESALGQGTDLKVYLPYVETGDTINLSRREATQPMPRGNETILLVEDEPSVRAVTAEALRLQGYKVLESGNGAEALELIEALTDEKVHLLLTDVVMPLMGGKILADKVKEHNPDTKILFTSGYTDDKTISKRVVESKSDFLPKPYTPFKVTTKVREVLDRR